MKRKTIKIILLCSVVIIVVGVLVWYLVPIKKNVTVSLCSVEGEKIEATFDVSWHRYLTAPTELKGTITIHDTVYKSLANGNYSQEVNVFWDKLVQKIKNEKETPYFRNKTISDSVRVMYLDMNFDKISMAIYQDSGDDEMSTMYYGPAETTEEANKILSMINE